MSDRSRRFSQLLCAPELTFAMEAHSGLSAKIVEEAGFPLIWASGLSISAAFGLCDRNEASCDCDTAVRDERWAALDQLRLDE